MATVPAVITIKLDTKDKVLIEKSIKALERYVEEHNRSYWRRLFDAILGRY